MKTFLAILGGFVASLGMFVGGVVVAMTFLTAEPVRQTRPSVDVADVWSAQPRVVDANAQNFERVAAFPLPDDQVETDATPTETANAVAAEDPASPPMDTTVITASVEPVTESDEQIETDAAPMETADPEVAEETAAPSVDMVTTASVEPVPEEDPVETSPAGQLSIAHIEWCASRYRSYRASDNSYQPYRGGRRPCVSPQSQDVASAAPAPSQDDYAEYAEYGDGSSPDLVEYASDDAGSSIYVTAEHVEYCFSRYRSYRPEDNTYQPYGGGPRRQCR